MQAPRYGTGLFIILVTPVWRNRKECHMTNPDPERMQGASAETGDQTSPGLLASLNLVQQSQNRQEQEQRALAAREEGLYDYLEALAGSSLEEALTTGIELEVFFNPADAQYCRGFLQHMAERNFPLSQRLRALPSKYVRPPSRIPIEAIEQSGSRKPYNYVETPDTPLVDPEDYAGNVFAYLFREYVERWEGKGFRWHASPEQIPQDKPPLIVDMSTLTRPAAPTDKPRRWSVRAYPLTTGQGRRNRRTDRESSYRAPIDTSDFLPGASGRRTEPWVEPKSRIAPKANKQTKDRDVLTLYLCEDGRIRLGTQGVALPPSYPFVPRALDTLDQYQVEGGRTKRWVTTSSGSNQIDGYAGGEEGYYVYEREWIDKIESARKRLQEYAANAEQTNDA